MKRLSMKRIWRDNTFEETYQFSGHQISKTQFVWYTFESANFRPLESRAHLSLAGVFLGWRKFILPNVVVFIQKTWPFLYGLRRQHHVLWVINMHINLKKNKQSIVTNYNSASGSSRNSCPTICKVFNTRYEAFANKILNRILWKIPVSKTQAIGPPAPGPQAPFLTSKTGVGAGVIGPGPTNQPTNQPFQHLFPNQNS